MVAVYTLVRVHWQGQESDIRPRLSRVQLHR